MTFNYEKIWPGWNELNDEQQAYVKLECAKMLEDLFEPNKLLAVALEKINKAREASKAIDTAEITPHN